MLKRMIEDEIAYEKKLLEKTRSAISLNDGYILIYSEGHFKYRPKGSNTGSRYIRKSDRSLLRCISGTRYLIEKAKILESNLLLLESVLHKLSDYDDETVISNLPRAHAKAAEYLKESAEPDEVIQSENPKHREKLIIKASNGLRVRTKSELNIAELLLSYDLNFRYEKALVLKDNQLRPDGSVRVREVTVYPDFTVFLADGSEFYIEISGLYDEPDYRKVQYEKFNMYYNNGIYMPKNLIVIMESSNKPLDMVMIRRIVVSQILPIAKRVAKK